MVDKDRDRWRTIGKQVKTSSINLDTRYRACLEDVNTNITRTPSSTRNSPTSTKDGVLEFEDPPQLSIVINPAYDTIAKLLQTPGSQ